MTMMMTMMIDDEGGGVGAGGVVANYDDDDDDDGGSIGIVGDDDATGNGHVTKQTHAYKALKCSIVSKCMVNFRKTYFALFYEL